MPRTIAYLGPAGTYTEEAALLYDPDAELQPFSTIAAVGSAVSTAITEQGVVPIENSLEGGVNVTLDLLTSQTNLYIYREIELPIQHYLMASAGVRPNQVEVIYSHPQSLGQCRGFLERCFPNVQQMASLSNAAAVNDMKQSSVPAAAIAPGRNAELYGVEIIGRNIQDNPNNVTRFVVLAPYDHPPTGNDKTSLCLSFRQDAPGVLYRALREFANRDINLRKIESRPTKQLLGEYIFLVDCDGHREDPPVKEAIDALNDSDSVLKVLGSYPRWTDQSTK